MNRLSLYLLTVLFFSASLLAADLTPANLSGKWVFTHMILDGTYERKVNLPMEFAADGVVINYGKSGEEKSRASYRIQGGNILYKDKHGEQKWKVLEFNKQILHVNHSGALMYFKRQ